MNILKLSSLVPFALCSYAPLFFVSAPQQEQASAVLEVYVAVDGSDQNPGTKLHPWRTIQHAASRLRPGEIVNVRAGVYHESVDIAQSGSKAGGFILFRSYPGEHAVLDGTGVRIVDGQQRGLFAIHNSSYLRIDGFELRNYRSSSVNADPAGISIDGAGEQIELTNNHVHGIGTSARGADCNSGSGHTADAFGVVVYGNQSPAAISHLLIDGNELDHLQTGCSEALSVNGNIDGFTITRNRLHDTSNIGMDVIGFEGVSPNPKYDQPRGGLIAANQVSHVSVQANAGYPGGDFSADGIYVDGGSGVVIERNVVDTADIGIEVASEAPNRTSSQVVVRNNLVFHNNSAGISIGGYDSNGGGADNVSVVNNTLVENDTQQTGSGELQIQHHSSNIRIANNLLKAGQQGLLLNSPYKLTAARIDFNLYDVASDSVEPNWVFAGSTFNRFATYRASSQQESHSLYAEPGFVNAAAEQFELTASSAALRRAINLGNSVIGTRDLAGNVRTWLGKVDIGAYQWKP